MDVVGIRFKPAGKILQYAARGLPLQRGDKCVAESENGVEIATVVLPPEEREINTEQTSIKPVMRQATVEDLEEAEGYRVLAQEAFALCRQRIAEMHMPMKLVEVEYTLDGRKAIFYFTADGRVDFRQLVRSLASSLQTRIEMRQIGVRDEAKKLGGYGTCGRPLCCSTFLTEFAPISVRMAKEQGLALNPSRISGVCGRLKCCLAYEIPVYKAIRDALPRVGDTYETEEGPGRVTDVTIMGEAFEVELDETGERIFVRLPSADERNYYCDGSKCGGCGNGGCAS
ncbi:stage 0 sporulation protein [Candidatus Entotheonella serta]|nr:stage 0 sporulation protein [Candidatus Entotheonella serta]